MAKRLRNRAMRNLKAARKVAGKAAAKITCKAVNALFLWLSTDHSGMGKALDEMPELTVPSLGQAWPQYNLGI